MVSGQGLILPFLQMKYNKIRGFSIHHWPFQGMVSGQGQTLPFLQMKYE